VQGPRGSAAHAARPEVDLVELEHAGFALGAHLRGVEVFQRLEDRVAVHAQALHEGGAALLQAIDAHCLRELDRQPLDAPVDGRTRQPPSLRHGRVGIAVDHLAQHLDRLQCLPAIAGGFRIVFHCCYSLDDGTTDGRWSGAAPWFLRAIRFLDVDGMNPTRPEHMHGVPASNARP